MEILVTNCFSWVGYHFLQACLEEGYMVDGYDDLKTTQQVHLSMFVARNAQFNHLESYHLGPKQGKYDLSVCVDTKDDADYENGCLRMIWLKHDSMREQTIALPPLFGPWMPITETGLLRANDEWVSFESRIFEEEALYIETYMKLLVHWIEAGQLATHYDGVKKRYEAVGKSELQDKQTIDCQLKETRAHYLNNRSLY